jgi:hypothetical protein
VGTITLQQADVVVGLAILGAAHSHSGKHSAQCRS